MLSPPLAASSRRLGAIGQGRYELLAEIGRGGMASVYVGRMRGPAGIHRTVAIKRLHAHLSGDPEFVALFLDEARVASFVQHANVLSANEVVQHDGELFIVMDYVPGESLAAVLGLLQRSERRMPIRMAAGILAGVLAGVHAAHATRDESGRPLHIVHRDVSPHNVLIGTDGVPRVIDFGVAKSLGQRQMTEEGRLKGKVRYMAPELIRGERPSPRADVFSASVVLWECLAGRRLFAGESEANVLLRVLESDITPPGAYNAEVTAALDAVVMRGLEREPERRYPSAHDMALAVEAEVGVVSAHEIATWLEEVAGESLRAREENVARLERTPAGATPEPKAALASTSRATDPTEMLARAPTGPRRWRAGAWVIAFAAGGALAALLLLSFDDERAAGSEASTATTESPSESDRGSTDAATAASSALPPAPLPIESLVTSTTSAAVVAPRKPPPPPPRSQKPLGPTPSPTSAGPGLWSKE